MSAARVIEAALAARAEAYARRVNDLIADQVGASSIPPSETRCTTLG